MRLVLVAALLFASCASDSHARRDPALASQAPRAGRERASRPRETPADPDTISITIEEPSVGTPEDTRPAIEVIEGRVSYYADSLAGHSTATGEPYDPTALTAASRDLPFGTIVRVVRIDTGASVVVRINDRGPFGRRTRILDLSRAAAEALDMIRAGVIEARAEVLERGATRRH